MARTIDIDIPPLTGRRAVVTGASDGMGTVIAARLAQAGAEVVMPVRDRAKGAAVADRIRSTVPDARLVLRDLDLASLDSVAAFGEGMRADGQPVHILINNAGLMTPPERRTTVDGFELQWGTNHLGHVALVGALFPLLQEGRARVTSQVSVVARSGAIDWEDLGAERPYRAQAAYRSSKIALGLFGLELDRRSAAAGWDISSNLAHPGVAPTNLLAAQPGYGRGGHRGGPHDPLAVRPRPLGRHPGDGCASRAARGDGAACGRRQDVRPERTRAPRGCSRGADAVSSAPR